MWASKRIETHGGIALLAVCVLACGEGATAPAARGPSATRVPSLPANLAATSLTGRIVYVNNGLRIYNLATSTDVSLGLSGVNPEFSPDGTLIAYQGGGIKVMNSDGSNVRVVSASGSNPSFDPTGTRIAFVNSGVWTVNVDGTGLRQVTTDDAHWPDWSPDGSQIAYGASIGRGSAQLFIVNADGTNRHQALTSGAVIDVTWQPSSRILLGISNGNYDLYSYDPAIPSSLTRLTTSTASDFEPSWSPDGTQIAWTSGTSGKTGGIWIMNADGSGQQGPVIPKGRQGSWGR